MIIQSDAYAGVVGTLVVAEVAKNSTMANDPACVVFGSGHADRQGTRSVEDGIPTRSMGTSVRRRDVVGKA